MPKTERQKLRALIDGERELRMLEDIALRLTRGKEQVLDVYTGVAEEVPLDALRISALDKAASIHQSLLRKVLPDAKAVEISGPEGETLQLNVASDRLALATKLLALSREAEEADEADEAQPAVEDLLG